MLRKHLCSLTRDSSKQCLSLPGLWLPWQTEQLADIFPLWKMLPCIRDVFMGDLNHCWKRYRPLPRATASGTSAGVLGRFPDPLRSRGNLLNCCHLLFKVPLLSWPWTVFYSLFDGTHTGFLCHSRNCRQEISGIISRDLTDKKVIMAKNHHWDSRVTEMCTLNLFLTKWAQFSPFLIVAVEKRWRDGDCFTYTQNKAN